MHSPFFLHVTAGLLLPLVLGCSTADGLDDGSGDTGEPPVPSDPLPLPEGQSCDEQTLGWRTQCDVLGQISYENPLAPGQFLDLPPFTGPTLACCEGHPNAADADAACVSTCIEQLCRMAEDIYDDIADENGWYCTTGCQFDYQGCVAGNPVQQFPHPPFGEDYPHMVTVSCEGTNVEPRHPDGSFEFIDSPQNYYYDDPELCGLPLDMQGYAPLPAIVANAAREDSGTSALATWWYGADQGKEGTSEMEATLEYAVRPCESDECLELGRLHATVPAGLYGGLSVQSAAVELVSTTAWPKIDRSGGFQFPAGSLHFVLIASVSDVPFAITRTNGAPVQGRVSPSADLIELTDLRLPYADTDFGAELRLDLVGAHLNRAPKAAIRRLENPLHCDQPVLFTTASVDLDGDPMQHYWWTPSGMIHGSTAELVLPAGMHTIVLVSTDDRGAHDATSLSYKRSCN